MFPTVFSTVWRWGAFQQKKKVVVAATKKKPEPSAE
jgi:hypothetical protein